VCRMDKSVGDKMVAQMTSPTTTLPEVTFRVLDDYVPPAGTVPQSADYFRYAVKTAKEIDSQIEYDMDEEVIVISVFYYLTFLKCSVMYSSDK